MLCFPLVGVLVLPCAGQGSESPSPADRRFEELADRYLDQFPALAPVSATLLGDHRFDGQLDRVTAAARARAAALNRRFLDELDALDPAELNRPNQVDHALLRHRLEAGLWRLEKLQEWAWNPLVDTGLAGNAIYGLMARQFAPLEERLEHVAERLEQFPRLLDEIRHTIQPQRVPRVHAETAIKQNRGVLGILDHLLRPHLGGLAAERRARLDRAIQVASAAIEEHQRWLESELLPHAAGDFRLGARLYDQKLAYTLQSSLGRREIRRRGEAQLRRLRDQMYAIAKDLYLEQYPYTRLPERPSEAYRQAIIRWGLERAYQETPGRDGIVEAAKRSLELTTAFVREKDLVTLPEDPLEIIVMPEFQRGVALAYCDSPGPLDVGQRTFYAVAPLPDEWTPEQVQSFLREYNLRSLHNLTIHEAMPGHFLQQAHSNRYPGTLRAILASGVFIEGWAVYTEQMMCDEGFLDHDPLLRLIVLKWYLRDTTNAILDQAVHTGGMTRDEAMRLLIGDAFQEEREAAAKWVRAQLTSAQLSTYFVGYLEHVDLRRDVEAAWGADFRLKKYHDRVLSFGSPPVRFVRALLLDEPIPR